MPRWRLRFTVEAGPLGRVYRATLDVPSAVDDLAGSFGRGGDEEITRDARGNAWLMEDVTGARGTIKIGRLPAMASAIRRVALATSAEGLAIAVALALGDRRSPAGSLRGLTAARWRPV